MGPEDPELLEGCRRGSAPAREAFVRRYAGLVQWAVRKTLGGESCGVEAADVFQEVFRKVFEPGALESLRDAQAVKGWLVVVSCRAALDAGRSAARRFSRESPLEALDVHSADEFADAAAGPGGAEPGVNPAQAVIDQEKKRIVREAIELLGPRERACVRYHYEEGWTHARIGELLGLSKDAVSAILHRCRERLRGLLEEGGYPL